MQKDCINSAENPPAEKDPKFALSFPFLSLPLIRQTKTMVLPTAQLVIFVFQKKEWEGQQRSQGEFTYSRASAKKRTLH